MMRRDAYSVIKRELSSGPKTSEKLREACKRAGIVDSTYYYHLKQLVEKLREVEEITEKDSKGRIVKKYALVEERREEPDEKVLWGFGPSGAQSFTVGDTEIEYPPNKALLEIAAWIKSNPTGWATDDDNVKRARLCLKHCRYLVPDVSKPLEDPDSYVFKWSNEAREALNLKAPVSSRFFDLKPVYDAVSADLSKESLSARLVFVGVYCTPVVVGYVGIYGGLMQPLRYVGHPSEYRPIEEPHSVCVAVCKEPDANIRVVHVETLEGKLDKAWVSGVAEQLNAKKFQMVGYDSLKEDARRKLLLNLRDVLEQRRLAISSRYDYLIEDLWEYSYRKPSSGYVLALAIAVNLSSN